MSKSKNLADELFPEPDLYDSEEVLDIPPNQRKLHTESYDYSISTIYEYLKSEHIYIPRYQRSYVWDRSQASKLIESLVIQCPIPILYLEQSYDSRFSVIDGNQRLTSIKLFLNDEFSLKGLTAYPELDGLFWSDLDPRIQRHIKNRTLRCIAILPDTHPQIKFDVFERLNTGSVKLNSQELRHGIYHGPLIDKVEKLAKSAKWKEVTRIKADKRMRRSELVLRYLAMANDLESYFKPLTGFLNQFAEKYQFASSETLEKFEDDFTQAVEKIHTLYGDLSFRPFNHEFKAQNAINTALLDAQMIAVHRLERPLHSFSQREREKLWKATADLFDERDFSMTIGAGTSSRSSVLGRIEKFSVFLNEQLG
ncbi:DUF262 domain-containing protein [Halomonas sp. DP1Y21-3]|uniref:DUF262 domain-containing protein n=1 Tax=Halomonas sp. DP1Y21-3 TaxID=2859080 RepID=UPI001C94F8AB|nr:DUF262 domain-containing protein [Halomonas sp. DP1Y21-3]MBY6109113.1 DUF262 domain-containing protein [Halomonas sp. DP1Y21-3]